MLPTLTTAPLAPVVSRASRRTGHGAPARIVLTERDIMVLSALHRYRMLDRRQVERLFFPPRDGPRRPGQASKAHERLRLLYQHGYVERIHRHFYPGTANPGPAYRLARRGAEVLAARMGVAPDSFRYWGRGDDRGRHPTRLSTQHVEHALLVADVRLLMEQAAAHSSCHIEQWLDEYDLQPTWTHERVWVELTPRRVRVEVAITPDGYFALATPKGKGHFFVELDRGTETIYRAWQRKIVGYKAYLRSGKFHARYGVSDANTGFRVLVLTPSLPRAQHITRAAEQYGPTEAAGLFLAAPYPRGDANILSAPIWLRGGATAPQALL